MQNEVERNYWKKDKIFRAGAGAGKTTRLVKEVYDFYEHYKRENGKLPSIILTTFTRKATQELKERLMLEAQKREDYEFLEFVLSKGHLKISTIHGILQVFLKQFSHLIDMDPGFKIIDDSEVQKQSKKILREILEDQSEATSLLEEMEFQDLIKNLIDHEQVKASNPNLRCPLISDFEAFLKNCSLEHSQKFKNISDSIRAETDMDKWLDFAEVLEKASQVLMTCTSPQDFMQVRDGILASKKPSYTKKSPPVSMELNEEIVSIKDEFKKMDEKSFDPLIWELIVQQTQIFDDLSKKFSLELEKYKKETGQISISDIETLSLELIRRFPLEIKSFSQNFDYWLIDEFQDTSPLQISILRGLVGDQKRFIVGDPQQSIFLFRGSRVQVFDEMEREVRIKQGEVQELNKNYRSIPSVMSFINYFFKNYKTPFKSMELSDKISEEKEVAKICIAESKEMQFEAILHHIQSLHKKDVPLAQICILGRKNSELKEISEVLQKNKIPFIFHSASGFLKRREVLDACSLLKFLVNPHDNFNLIEVLRSPWFRVSDEAIYEVTQLKPESFWLEFLRIKSNPSFEAIQRLESYYLETYKISITQTFQNILMDTGFFELSQCYDPSGRREANLWKLLTQLKTEDHRVGFNYLDFIDSRSKMVDLDSDGSESDAVSAIEPNRVQLMTIHKSKGLEFDYVMIPNLEAEYKSKQNMKYFYDESLHLYGIRLLCGEETTSLPLFLNSALSKKSEEELEEQDRLLYVAMTRAKKGLFLFSKDRSPKSKSWLDGMRMDLRSGIHEQEGFSYMVDEKGWRVLDDAKKGESSKKIIKPLFDLKQVAQSKLQSTITSQVKETSIESKPKIDFISLATRAQFGTQSHKVFESLRYGNEIEEVEFKSALNYIRGLKDVPVLEILKKGHAEWGFSFKKEGSQMNGQIDLWSKINDDIWILDYKTGSSRYSDMAFEQLEKYAEALKSYITAQKTYLVALYPFEEKHFIREYK